MSRWIPPNDPTKEARQIWDFLFYGSPWPRRLTVRWVRRYKAAYAKAIYPDTDWTRVKEIRLAYNLAKADGNAVATLVHEFIHVRNPRMRHGKAFEKLVTAACGRLGIKNDGAPD